MYSDEVKHRIGGVKKVQNDYKNLFDKYLEENMNLEKKYDALFLELFKKREKVINGEYEPAEEDLVPADSIGLTESNEKTEKEAAVKGMVII